MLHVAAGGVGLALGCTKRAQTDSGIHRPLASTARAPTSARGRAGRAGRTIGKTIVGIGTGKRYTDAVSSALRPLGGLGAVKRGDKVLLKVNTNSGDPYPYSTNPELIRFLGSQLRARGAQVFVGDRSFWGDRDTAGNLRRNGIAAAAAAVGAKLVVFGDDNTDWVRIPNKLIPHWRGQVHVPRVAVEADHLFNLPCVKTHFITTFTMSLKNVLGLVKAGDRARAGNLRSHDQDRIYHQIAEINRFVRPSLNILDGYKALVTGGPTPASGASPTIVEPRLIVASTDRVATDVVGVSMLRRLSPRSEQVTRYAPWKNPLIAAAVAANLGVRSGSQLVLKSDTVTDLDNYRT